MQIERVRRPFWTHQVIEYLVGIGLISAAVQMPNPTAPALLGLLIILNTAVAKGGAGAFRLVGPKLHRSLDLVVIGGAVVLAVQPWIPLDGTSRMMIGAIAFVLWFVWFHTDFAVRETLAERKARRAAAKAARGPVDSHAIGRGAGRVVGSAIVAVRRRQAGDDVDGPAAPPPAAPWAPPTSRDPRS